MSEEQSHEDNAEQMFVMTPKGHLMHELLKFGLSESEAESVWNSLALFCWERSGKFPALIFDGIGGDVIQVAKEPYEGGDANVASSRER